MDKIKFASLCAGCGGIDLGLETAGMECVYACEIDRHACGLYRRNLNPNVLFEGSLFDIDPNAMPDFDLLCAGFPCQPFSVAGKRRGLEDPRGNVFFGIARILEAKKTPIVLLENVKGLVSHDGGNTLRVILNTLYDLGYAVRHEVLNARTHANVPQNRERIFIVGFLDRETVKRFAFPAPVPLTVTVRDVIDFDAQVDDSFYLSRGSRKREVWEAYDSNHTPGVYRYSAYTKSKAPRRLTGGGDTSPAVCGRDLKGPLLLRQNDGRLRFVTPSEYFAVQGFPVEIPRQRIARRLDEAMDDPGAIYQQRGREIRKNKSGVIPALIARLGTGGNNEPIIRTSDGGIRKITPRECFNAMGFGRTFDISGVSKSQAYKIAGNSVCVPLIERIGRAIIDAVDGTGAPGPRQTDLFEGLR